MNSGRNDRSSLTKSDQLSYPIKERRYWRTWWNANAQYCYDDDDIALLKRIDSEYQTISDSSKKGDYFSTSDDKRWREWWTCTKPSYNSLLSHFYTESFTLPTRESKDSKAYPLWNYADNMARQIANWQSERVKKQNPDLMNDPVMLIFEELRDWFYNNLAENECKKEVLDQIAKRQSYIKSLIHLIPNFGPDRLRLHEIQHSLEDASRTVRSCIANKELPQLLSDIIISGKSLESTLGTYLHFLLIDEEVADNFSSDYLEGKQRNCQLSPVCKIYRSIQETSVANVADSTLKKYQAVNRFYDLIKVAEDTDSTHLQLKLKEHLVKTVKFASFATSQDRKNYLEAIAALEALINVRKTLEKFNNVQSRIGTYVFAVNYLDKANSLATHYINLISKTKLLIKGLIKSADDGLNSILGNQENRKQNKYFEKNLRSLETRVAKGTTVTTQLDTFCYNAAESMNKYQQEMKKLVSSVNSGEASREIELAMRDLYQQMNDMNTVLPALLDDSYIKIINHSHDETALCTSSKTSVDTCEIMREHSGKSDYDIPSRINEEPSGTAAKSSDEKCRVDAPAAELTDPQDPQTCAQDQLHFNSGKWDVRHGHINASPIFIFQLFNGDAPVGSLEFHGELAEIKKDAVTNEPIFVYSYRDNGAEIGSAEFYGQPDFCVSADRQKHNILKTTGILNQFTISDERMSIENEICRVLPPSLLQNIIHSAGHSALHGFLRGGANVVAAKAPTLGLPRQVLSQLTYFGAVFTWKFGTYYSQIDEEEKNANSLNAMYKAAWLAAYETGQIALFNIGFTMMSSLLEKAGDSLENNNWTRLGKGLKKCSSLVRYGFFAYNVVGSNLSSPTDMAKAAAVTTASVVSGAAAEILTEKVGKALIT